MELAVVPDRLIIGRDGAIVRPDTSRQVVPAKEEFVDGVATRDVVLDTESGIWARIFLPESSQAVDETPGNGGVRRLPVLVYFHGGGFVIGSTSWADFHEFISHLSRKASVICVSVEYRLAPEHRLPTAFDDCFAALQWLHSQALLQSAGGGGEPWIDAHADFSRCYLAGESAGANIVHNMAVRATGIDWSPMKFQGLIMIQPFFGGEERNTWEKEVPSDVFVPLHRSDLLWSLALPSGANRDHPACNPLSADSPKLEDIDMPSILVAVASQDMLKERGVRYFKELQKAGKKAHLIISENVDHIFQLNQPNSEAAAFFMEQLVGFINSSTPE
eukprot:c24867_g1_i1 orf=233-1228(+)